MSSSAMGDGIPVAIDTVLEALENGLVPFRLEEQVPVARLPPQVMLHRAAREWDPRVNGLVVNELLDRPNARFDRQPSDFHGLTWIEAQSRWARSQREVQARPFQVLGPLDLAGEIERLGGDSRCDVGWPMRCPYCEEILLLARISAGAGGRRGPRAMGRRI